MRRADRGATLVELVVAMVIITIGILGFFGAFQYITRALHISRSRSLATNLGQEKIETLKNLSYYNLLVTTSTSQDNNFTPAIVYDNSNYPPETITIGGINFLRYTFVGLAQINNDAISTVTFTYPDTGMKQITTTIAWNDGGRWKSWALSNLYENPNIAPLDATITGAVNLANGLGVASALVKVEQNPDYQTTADVNGNYSFHVYQGSYTIRASSTGFYDGVSPVLQATSGSNTQVSTITLTAIATGTIAGEVWISSYVMFTQVVMATQTATRQGPGVIDDVDPGTGITTNTVEYIEIFNPTPQSLNLGPSHGLYSNETFSLIYYDSPSGGCSTNCAALDDPGITGYWQDWNLVKSSTYIPPLSYYLIANASSFMINGTWFKADAYYGTLYHKIMDSSHAGTLVFYYGAPVSNFGIDDVRWTDQSGITPSYFTGLSPTVIPNAGGNFSFGTPAGQQIVRVSSPGASTSDIQTFARAYNSGSNTLDWLYPSAAIANPAFISPKNIASGTQTQVAGIPAVGAYISASDPYSGSTVTPVNYITSGTLSLPYAPFKLVGVTTTPALASCGGSCWIAVASSLTYSAEVDTITITQNVASLVPGANTSASWSPINMPMLFLTPTFSGSATYGYVEGRVTDINNNPLNAIPISVNGITKNTSSNGDYFVTSSTGAVTVVANPNSTPPYVMQIAMPTVNTGQITTQNFTMVQGGSLQGYVTAGTTPLPNIVVVAISGGAQQGAATSNTGGNFLIKNISTGTYTVAPVIDPDSTSSPLTVQATVSSTGTIWVGTFTITSAMGAISGTISNNNATVTSGALILASTASIPSSPSAVVASSSPAQMPLYMISSLADGTYSVPVRGSNTYYLSVYVPVISNTGAVSITTKTYSGVYVAPSLTTTKAVTLP